MLIARQPRIRLQCTGSDIADLDSGPGHVDAELSVIVNKSRQFLIFLPLNNCFSAAAGYLNNWGRAARAI